MNHPQSSTFDPMKMTREEVMQSNFLAPSRHLIAMMMAQYFMKDDLDHHNFALLSSDVAANRPLARAFSDLRSDHLVTKINSQKQVAYELEVHWMFERTLRATVQELLESSTGPVSLDPRD